MRPPPGNKPGRQPPSLGYYHHQRAPSRWPPGGVGQGAAHVLPFWIDLRVQPPRARGSRQGSDGGVEGGELHCQVPHVPSLPLRNRPRSCLVLVAAGPQPPAWEVGPRALPPLLQLNPLGHPEGPRWPWSVPTGSRLGRPLDLSAVQASPVHPTVIRGRETLRQGAHLAFLDPTADQRGGDWVPMSQVQGCVPEGLLGQLCGSPLVLPSLPPCCSPASPVPAVIITAFDLTDVQTLEHSRQVWVRWPPWAPWAGRLPGGLPDPRPRAGARRCVQETRLAGQHQLPTGQQRCGCCSVPRPAQSGLR